MVRRFRNLGLVLALCLATGTVQAAITGTVFRDYDGDGTQDAREPGVGGVTLTAYNAAGTAVATTTSTIGSGAFSLATTGGSGVPFRIELTGLDGQTPGPVAGLQFGASGSSGQVSNVRFVNDTDSGVTFGIQAQQDFCQAPAQLRLLSPRLSFDGNTDAEAAETTRAAAYDFPYTASGAPNYSQQNVVANDAQVGSTYGVAYQRAQRRVFLGAAVKRHTSTLRSLGQGAPGAIFVVPRTGTDTWGTPTLFVNLNDSTVFPTGTWGTNPAGVDTRNTATNYNFEQDGFFDEIGRRGLGDIELSADERELFVVVLQKNASNENYLYRLPATGTSITSDANVQRFVIPEPGCVGGAANAIPYALEEEDGYFYVGGVCNAQGSTAANLRAYVYRFDPATNTFSSSPVLNIPLNYTRDLVDPGPANNANWLPWQVNVAALSCSDQCLPQPILADLEFDRGDMLLGFRDRWGDQSGAQRITPNQYRGITGGDLLRACRQTGGGFTIESAGTCSGINGTFTGRTSPTARQEIYGLDNFDTGATAPRATTSGVANPHGEVAVGALVQVPGYTQVAVTVFDAFDSFNTGGVRWFNNNAPLSIASGDLRGYDIFNSSVPGGRFTSKATGMGDLEALCDPSPIIIGNRLFRDDNGNGRQDAGETFALSGVNIELRSASGALLGQTTTDANGNWRFTITQIATGTDPSNTDADVRLLATALYGQIVSIYVPGTDAAGAGLGGVGNVPSGLFPTVINFNDSLPNFAERNAKNLVVDPDGSGALPARLGTVLTLPSSPGINRYNLDFGFRSSSVPTNSLGNRVWYDTDNDGVFDTGEQGIEGVVLELRNSTNTAAINDPAVSTPTPYTVTSDAQGYYRFDNLPNGSYVVRVAASNFQSGGVLFGYLNSSVTGAVTTDATNKGLASFTAPADGIVSGVYTLTTGSNPTGEATAISSPLSINGPYGDANDNLRVDFGFYRIVIEGTVHDDTGAGTGGVQNDGVRNGTEPFLAGVTVELRDSSNTLIASTTTDASGNYRFDRYTTGPRNGAGLDPTLSYRVVIVDPPLARSSSTPRQTTPSSFSDNNNKGAPASLSEIRSVDFSVSPGGITGGQVVTASDGTTRQPTIDFALVEMDFGDLPDTASGTGTDNYQTQASDTGARNLVTNQARLGVQVLPPPSGAGTQGYDSNVDGPQSSAANGDDAQLLDDENGLSITSIQARNTAFTVATTVTKPSGTGWNLCGYLDFNDDGDFLDSGEAATFAFGAGALTDVTQNLSFTPPAGFANTALSQIYGRFRIQNTACSAVGFGGLGEVEDYRFDISRQGPLTVAVTGGAAACPGRSVTLTFTISNPSVDASQANAVPVSMDLVGSDEPALAGVPQFADANWAVTATSGGASAALTAGSGDLSTTLTLPPSGSITFTIQGTFANTATFPRTVTGALTVPSGFTDTGGANSADTAFTADSGCTSGPLGHGALCPDTRVGVSGGYENDRTISSTVTDFNTYYPSRQSVSNTQAAGLGSGGTAARCLVVGSAQGGGPAVAAGDLLLIVQMQEATVAQGTGATGSNVYGDNAADSPGGATAASAGTYEYAIAVGPWQEQGTGPRCSGLGGTASDGIGVIEINGAGADLLAAGDQPRRGVINSYTHQTTAPQARWQVVRVPRINNLSFTGSGQIDAPAWSGEWGGIIAVEVLGTLDLGSSAATRFNADGDGFRGGLCRTQGSNSTATDLFRVSADAAASARKGEGYAGTPCDLPGAPACSSANGYVGGDEARGAPGNAGGGGQRCAANSVTGGGGGAGGSRGGIGGAAGACTGVTSHAGGVLPAGNDLATRLVLGGGGGAGARSAASGNCAGGAGGGAIVIRANALTSSAATTLAANGNTGNPATALTDVGGGGGGGGGSIIVLTNLAGGTTYTNITLSANGGNGGASTGAGRGSDGSGGGGGGGRVFRALTAVTPGGTVNIAPGAAGSGGTGGAAGLSGLTTIGIDPVNNSPGVKPGFVCDGASTVPVTIAAVDSRRIGNELEVSFDVASEAGTLGYHVWADAEGIRQRLNGSLIEARANAHEALSYRVRGPNLGYQSITIEEVEVSGKRVFYGPYAIGAQVGERGYTVATDWPAVRAEQRAFRQAQVQALRGRSAEQNMAELGVERSGWVRVTYEELLAAGVDFSGIASDRLRLSRGELAVPLTVRGPERFGPGSAIEFPARAVDGSLYTRRAVYRLSVGAPLALGRIDAANAASTRQSQYVHEETVAPNLRYGFSSPLPDPWFALRVLRQGQQGAPGVLRVPVNDRIAGTAASVSVELWGGTDLPEAPDHRVQILVNGMPVAERVFDGLTAERIEAPVPEGLLREGDNQVEVVLLDNGLSVDLVNVEAVRLRYTRSAVMRDGRLRLLVQSPGRSQGEEAKSDRSGSDGALPGGGGGGSGGGSQACTPDGVSCQAFRITGLENTEVRVYRWRGTEVVELLGTRQGSELTLAYAAQEGDELWIEQQSVPVDLAPARGAPNLLAGPAQYLVIGHPSFLDGLGPLIAARQAEGLSTRVVDVEDVYRRYSNGEIDPQAITRYVRDSVLRTGTRYVLLVGGDTIDPFNYLGNSSQGFVPTQYTVTHPVVRFAPSDGLYGDLNGDRIAEIPVGRLPVRTRAELDQTIARILGYPSAGHHGKALFVSDREQTDYSYAEESEQLIERLHASWTERSELKLDDYALGQAAQARADLAARVNAGLALLSWYGHSSPSTWSREGLLTAPQVYGGLFGNAARPTTVVQWGCWGAYFVDPRYNTLAHAFLLAPSGGAATYLGASGLTETSNDTAFGGILLPLLSQPGVRVGDALVEAQRQMALQYGASAIDVTVGTQLLGDPALKIAR